MTIRFLNGYLILNQKIDGIQWFAICGTLPEQLLTVLKGKPFQETLDTEENPKLNEIFLEGIGAYYNGTYHQSIPAFMSILKTRPNHKEARYWLAKSYMKSNFVNNAKIELKSLQENDASYRKVEILKLLKELDE